MRYLSREIQRQFAKILLDANVDRGTLEDVAVALHAHNQSYPNAFKQYLTNQGIYIE